MEQRRASPESREILANSRCFADVSPDVLDRMFSCMHERSYEAGEVIMRQGAAGDFLLVLIEGRAHARVRHADGETREVGSFGPTEVAGELALLTNEPRTADVIADRPVRALALPIDAFQGLAMSHPEVGIVLTYLVAARLGKTTHDGLGGKVVGDYRIRRCVGRGGMAIVYEAEPVGGGDSVALKMMSHRLVYEPGALSRFRREAKIVASLRHDNVAQLYGRFSAYNTQFLVLEFCDGPTLKGVIKANGPIPEPEARLILGQLARGLRYVHAQGVIHRDLKPGNVMLNRRGEVKLTDFGLAKPEMTIATESATREGALIGTPWYMSPEHLAGEQLDARADIYALACLAFELLHGRSIFTSNSFLELAQEKLQLEVPQAARIGGGVSDEMHDFIARGLQVKPDDRTVSLGQLEAWSGAVPAKLCRSAPGGEQPDPTARTITRPMPPPDLDL